MSNTPDNPQAFPVTYGDPRKENDCGMTLLDYFAGQALPHVYQNWYKMWIKNNLISPSTSFPALEASEDAYYVARTMLKVREDLRKAREEDGA